MGLGAVATTGVLALELDGETLVDIFEEQFPFLLETIKETSRRHLDFIRTLKRLPDQLPAILRQPFLWERMHAASGASDQLVAPRAKRVSS